MCQTLPSRHTSATNGGGMLFGSAALILVIYAVGLTHGIARPWTGMHDWNGAFFAQLARNALRYPLELSWGMPVVAVGEAVPPPAERSVYATHPPGLVGLVALAFRLLGQSEWTARLVPVLFSLASLGSLVWLVDQAWGRELAWVAGLVYAVMPMPVYFGRMVDHEAVCLGLMLMALVGWELARGRGDRRMIWCAGGKLVWAVAICAGVWVDWSGALFAALFVVWACVDWRRGGIDGRRFGWAGVVPLLGCGTMLVHLVYAGLDGHWSDLAAIFLSRATEAQGGTMLKDASATGGPWDYTIQNLTWPVIILMVIGVVAEARRRLLSGGRQGSSDLGHHTTPSDKSPAQDRETTPVGNRCHDGRGMSSKWGLCVLTAAGLLWLVVFWRQYERHNYWLFYLGPAAAVLSARGVLTCRGLLGHGLPRAAAGIKWALLVIVVGFGLRGSDDYFSRVSYPPEEAAAWQGINARTRAGDRVLLFRNPVRSELRGEYHFRNLVPPQLAYYLDRSFDVEGELERVPERAQEYAGFMIDMEDGIVHGERLSKLRRLYREVPIGTKVWFDLRAAPPDGASRGGWDLRQ